MSVTDDNGIIWVADDMGNFFPIYPQQKGPQGLTDPMTGQALPDPTDVGMMAPAVSQDQQQHLEAVKQCEGCSSNQGDRYCDKNGYSLLRAITLCQKQGSSEPDLSHCDKCSFQRKGYCGKTARNYGYSIPWCKSQSQSIRVKPI